MDAIRIVPDVAFATSRGVVSSNMNTNDSQTVQQANLSPEQVQALADAGLPIDPPHRSTILRRAANQGRVFPVISRSNRSFVEDNGRPYGEVDPAHQRQADAKYWLVGAAVRRDLEPMTVAVDGIVVRIYEVLAWNQDQATGKWVAALGRSLTDADLDQDYPDYPYRIGDPCRILRGRAYRPETY